MKDKIVQIGDPVLATVAKPVAKKDITSRKVQTLLTKMRGVLANEQYGVALAAPQIGASLRIFIIAGKVFKSEDEDAVGNAPMPPDRVFINPEFIRKSKSKKEMTEGCLSVRHKYGSVIRHEKASVKALDEKGQPFVYHGNGLVAQIFQHEIDHLDGTLYTDIAVAVTEDHDWNGLKVKQNKDE